MLNVCVQSGVGVYFNVVHGGQVNVKQQKLIGCLFLQRAFKMTCVTAKAEYSKGLITCRRVNDVLWRDSILEANGLLVGKHFYCEARI